MFARALIVVLVALNLGVAVWWLSRPAPVPATAPVSDKGGAALRLLPMYAAAMAASAAPAPAPVEDHAVAGPAPAQACLRIGPFTNRAAADAARNGLGAALRDPELREEPGQASRYRVLLPPAGDRAQAQASADRIAAAGFDDFLILSQGAEANGIALGTYTGRDAAERRAAALGAAGFPAKVQAQGAAGASQWWLLGAGADPVAVRAAFPATQELDCASLPETALR